MKFFLDNTFPPRFAPVLRELAQDVIHLREIDGFDGSTLDTEWMPHVAKQRWTAVTGDGRILTRPHERELWRSLKLTLFIFHKGYPRLELWDQLLFLLKHWPNLTKNAERATRGAAYEVTARGKIRLRDG